MTAKTTKSPLTFSIVTSALGSLPWSGIAIYAVILLMTSLIGIFWPWLKAGEGIEIGESNSTTLRNVGLLVGGAIAIWLGFWRARVADSQSKAATDQAEAAKQQAETARRTSLNDRYQRAVEFLGSGDLPIRIGAIHTLSLLAREDPESFYRQFRELGCAFVRQPPHAGHLGTGLKGTREDVDAVMQALGSRTAEQVDIEERQKMRLPLWSVDLRNYDLHKLNLSRSIFLDAKLDNAILAETKLVRVIFSNANLSKAFLFDADLSSAVLCGANLTGADLSDANLAGANLSKTFFSLHMYAEDVDLLLHPTSSSAGANLTDVRLVGANLENANLAGANLAGTRFYEHVSAEGHESDRGASGLTQEQLDSAIVDPPDRSPILDGLLDAKTGRPLLWKSRKGSL